MMSPPKIKFVKILCTPDQEGSSVRCDIDVRLESDPNVPYEANVKAVIVYDRVCRPNTTVYYKRLNLEDGSIVSVSFNGERSAKYYMHFGVWITGMKRVTECEHICIDADGNGTMRTLRDLLHHRW